MEKKKMDSRMAAAIFSVVHINGLAKFYALDVTDYIDGYNHKFSSGVYKAIEKVKRRSEELEAKLYRDTGDTKAFAFFSDTTVVNYNELKSYIFKFENAVFMLLSKNKVRYSQIAAKVYVMNILTKFAMDVSKQIVNELGPTIKTDGTLVSVGGTLNRLSIKPIHDAAGRLFGMFCGADVDINSDINCTNGYAALYNKLTSPEFHTSILDMTEDMQNGISKEKRKEMNERAEINKLAEHFGGTTV